MDTVTWLVVANAAVWLGLGAYLIFLTLEQRALAARLKQWETLRPEHQ